MTNGLKILSNGTVAQEVTRNGVVLGYVWPVDFSGARKWKSASLTHATNGMDTGALHRSKAAAVGALVVKGGGA